MRILSVPTIDSTNFLRASVIASRFFIYFDKISAMFVWRSVIINAFSLIVFSSSSFCFNCLVYASKSTISLMPFSCNSCISALLNTTPTFFNASKYSSKFNVLFPFAKKSKACFNSKYGKIEIYADEKSSFDKCSVYR